MKRFFATLSMLAGALCALGGEARSLRRMGAFCEGLVDIRWDAAYPVAIQGWSGAELGALWKRIDALCFLPASCPVAGVEDARPEGLLRRVAETVAAPEGAELSERSLSVMATVRIPFATKDWVGLAYDGYDNAGGNGCHALGCLVVLARKGLTPMPLTWFAKDPVGLQREVIRRLEEALREQEGGCPPFTEYFSREAAESATPEFLPTPGGVRFRYDAYEILPGCYGMPEVTVPWRALVPFCDVDRLTELKSLLPKQDTPTQE